MSPLTFAKGSTVLVDLDGTLAHYTEWKGAAYIGEPVLPMVTRVKEWLSAGVTVKVFTARVGPQKDVNEAIRSREVIAKWTLQHVGQELDVTASKDYTVAALFDDRAYQVEHNTGRIVGVDV